MIRPLKVTWLLMALSCATPGFAETMPSGTVETALESFKVHLDPLQFRHELEAHANAHPEDPIPLHYLGHLCLEVNDVAGAVSWFEQYLVFLEGQPSAGPLRKKLAELRLKSRSQAISGNNLFTCRSLLRHAELAAESGQWQEARSLAMDSLAKNPSGWEACVVLAMAGLHLQLFEESWLALQRAAELAPASRREALAAQIGNLAALISLHQEASSGLAADSDPAQAADLWRKDTNRWGEGIRAINLWVKNGEHDKARTLALEMKSKLPPALSAMAPALERIAGGSSTPTTPKGAGRGLTQKAPPKQVKPGGGSKKPPPKAKPSTSSQRLADDFLNRVK